jgi:hypothetical protein
MAGGPTKGLLINNRITQHFAFRGFRRGIELY